MLFGTMFPFDYISELYFAKYLNKMFSKFKIGLVYTLRQTYLKD